MAGQEDDLSELLSSITASSATSSETNFASTTGAPSRVQNSAAENTNAASSSAAGGSGSSIQWGPAITASPLPSSEVNQDNDNNNNNSNSDPDQESSGSGLSGNAKKVIICTTTIGGTFILALLIYALCRRRRGASYSEIVRFRLHSSTVVLNPMSEDERLTALPIYRQDRISIRSSRHPSRLDLAQQSKRVPRMPSSLRKEWRVEEPVDRPSSRPKTPKTPTKQEGRSFLKDATPPSKQVLHEPEQAHVPLNRVSTLSLPLMRHSVQPQPPTQNDTIEEHDQRQLESMSPPHSPDSQLDLHQRWSWTNSQAPSTPRIKPPTRTSLTSLRLGSVASWVKSQRNDEDEKQRQAHKRGLSRPLLKNQAIRPVLAPAPPSKKLSKKGKHGRVGSLSSIFKPNPNSLVPQPLSPRVEEGNLSSPEETSIEMKGKS
ncbi:hypothetical protein M409DRAFT_21664 [Zasmidium cellare ATCC 36951]|uniref:Uncharacterized protein n=1 Tax=Zasmidium cellare ATCC 36951 TaxID=1080233 RepID=A0A6A6CNK4_ZASCE|nr:uncharacterized protein M409DRAFT_21664 [Zasmidium cellare ATCC 36951]KAF2168223.1 hypothetical protein M409DRAFT_21664 [Zasmidium cellare ATCC 36951]